MNDVDEDNKKISLEQRRRKMIDLLVLSGSVQIDELAEKLSVSRMTIHRDLDSLAKQGLVRKVRGAASVLPSVRFESNYHYRNAQQRLQKRRLAQAVASKLEPGEAIIIDDSTTTRVIAELLPQETPFTVITNAYRVIEHLLGKEQIELITVGGSYNAIFDAFLGVLTEQAFGALRADTVFLSSSAVSGFVVYHQDQEVIRAKRAMLMAADKKVLVLDHTKLGKSALNRFADLSEFDEVVIGHELDKGKREALIDAGVPLTIV